MLFNSLTLALLAGNALALPGNSKPSKPKGFVTTSGTKFKLDGKDFNFAGSNAYYFPFDNAPKKAGLKVFRTWGFNEKNATYIAGGLPQYGSEGAGGTEVVFQRWADGKGTIDISAFDKVVNAAANTGIKLILTLTNNWADYGGMDVYTVNVGGVYHDDFYRLAKTKSAYKKYVKAIVIRYKDKWYDEMSSFIRSHDKNHLITSGTEGGFNQVSDDWAYNGSDGGDFDAELKLKNIDFGTFHSYPDWWSKTVEWTNQWIKDHAASGRNIGKPVVHEEYGWLTPEARMTHLNRTENATRVEVISQWQAISLKEKMSDMYWQFGFSNYSYGRNNNDGFTIYLDEPEAQPLVFQHAEAMNKL
ncbi:putative mannan endo-1,4-beta-mannosidase C [Cryoendolithus antarcticus]|uniref:mannan endo-1,4-beta-mannosidase n=1 Tax=Cryoendolithus antarcticus TaxID=1507870 RepID=A0A1V8S8J3_9PEZI|nr:putative mannan endo-1,4-beta-mannosidase C [Cryoendolithus antarcticus]